MPDDTAETLDPIPLLPAPAATLARAVGEVRRAALLGLAAVLGSLSAWAAGMAGLPEY